jgi:hypothetical protein
MFVLLIGCSSQDAMDHEKMQQNTQLEIKKEKVDKKVDDGANRIS